ncbi:MAG: tRNA pseudouridine(55) synthase TruB [Pseudomonadota bacterium]
MIDKPAGPTSFGVVSRLKRASRIKKVGHTGTLDPMATGVLCLCFNQATKLVPFLQEGAKEYSGRFLLGLTTDTDDLTGRVTSRDQRETVDEAEVIRGAAEFVGPIWQVPPDFSAVKIGGRPAYKLARSGEKPALKARLVTIHDFRITGVDGLLVSFFARVSKGTYIRSLAADLGRRLGLGGCLESLRRLTSEPFGLQNSVSLEAAEEAARQDRLGEILITLEQALSFLPEVKVSGELARMASHGRPLPLSDLTSFDPRPGPVRVRSDEAGLLAVYEYKPTFQESETGYLSPLRVMERK